LIGRRFKQEGDVETAFEMVHKVCNLLFFFTDVMKLTGGVFPCSVLESVLLLEIHIEIQLFAVSNNDET